MLHETNHRVEMSSRQWAKALDQNAKARTRSQGVCQKRDGSIAMRQLLPHYSGAYYYDQQKHCAQEFGCDLLAHLAAARLSRRRRGSAASSITELHFLFLAVNFGIGHRTIGLPGNAGRILHPSLLRLSIAA